MGGKPSPCPAVLLLCVSPHQVPRCLQHVPARQLAGRLPLPTCLGPPSRPLQGPVCPPEASPSSSPSGGGVSTQPGHKNPQRAPPLPDTSWGGIPTGRPRSPTSQRDGPCPAASPALLEASPWPFPSASPEGQLTPGEPGRAPAQGGAWALTSQAGPPDLLLGASTAPTVAAKTGGPGRQLCPRSPRKCHHGLGAPGSGPRPVMEPPQQSCRRPVQQAEWGRQVALCGLPSPGPGGGPL